MEQIAMNCTVVPAKTEPTKKSKQQQQPVIQIPIVPRERPTITKCVHIIFPVPSVARVL